MTDEAARAAVAAACKLPAPLGDRLLRYVGLFRPRKHALSWPRAAKLLTELQNLIEGAVIERNGQIWGAPVDYWKRGLDEVLARTAALRLPLTGHGYLLEIIAGIAQQAAAKAEQDRETVLRRHPSHQVMAPRQGLKSAAELVTPAMRAKWDRQLEITPERK